MPLSSFQPSYLRVLPGVGLRNFIPKATNAKDFGILKSNFKDNSHYIP